MNLWPALAQQTVGGFTLTPLGNGSYQVTGNGPQGRIDGIPLSLESGTYSLADIAPNTTAIFRGITSVLHSDNNRVAALPAGEYTGSLVIRATGVITPALQRID